MNPKSILPTFIPAVAVILLLAVLPAFAQNGVWTNKTSGLLWNTATNWTNATVADGSAATGTADFSQVDIPAGTFTVHLNASHNVTNMIFGDTGTPTAGSWVLDDNGSSGANVLTLSGTSPAITVNTLGTSATATISATIAGTTAWSKQGAGLLILTGNNTCDAPTTIGAQGTGISLQANSIGNVGGGASAMGSPSTAANGQINLGRGATFIYGGSIPASSDRLFSNFGTNGNSFQIQNSGGVLTLNGGVTNTVTPSIGSITLFQWRGISNIVENGAIYLGPSPMFVNGALSVFLTNALNSITNFITVVGGGKLSVTSIADPGQPSVLGGSGSLVLSGNATSAGGSIGKFEFTGTNGMNSSSIPITIGSIGASAYTGNAQLIANETAQPLILSGPVSAADNTNKPAYLVLVGLAGQTGNANLGAGILSGNVAGPNTNVQLQMISGTWTVSGTNTFNSANRILVNGGTLQYTTITNVGAGPSALGAPTTVGNGTIDFGNNGTLMYVGTGGSSDRVLNHTGGGQWNLGNNGTGPLILTGGMTSIGSSGGNLLFRGTNNITLSGLLSLGSEGVGNVGTGVITLSNPNNTFAGNFAINLVAGLWCGAGTISANSIANSGVVSAIGNGDTIQFGFSGQSGKLQFTGASGGSSDRALVLNNTTNGGGGILENTVAGQTLSLSGAISCSSLTAAGPGYPSSLGLTGAGNGVLSGGVSDGSPVAITKSGTGTWTLTGANYPGPTVVSNGTLVIDATVGSTNVSSVAGGTLGGTGTILDELHILSGGTLSGGTNNVPGTLTISSNLLVAGTLVVAVNKSLAQSNSLLVVSGIITNTGGASVAVNNVGPALAVGNSFTLFSQAVSNGAAMTISPAPGAGLAWQNNLAVDGSISVVTGVASYPTNISYSTSGSTLTLTWPATHLGWYAQSNSVNLADTNYWFDIAGSQSGTNLVISINPAQTNVFYRLRKP